MEEDTTHLLKIIPTTKTTTIRSYAILIYFFPYNSYIHSSILIPSIWFLYRFKTTRVLSELMLVGNMPFRPLLVSFSLTREPGGMPGNSSSASCVLRVTPHHSDRSSSPFHTFEWVYIYIYTDQVRIMIFEMNIWIFKSVPLFIVVRDR
jgi:hypothetical protein